MWFVPVGVSYRVNNKYTDGIHFRSPIKRGQGGVDCDDIGLAFCTVSLVVVFTVERERRRLGDDFDDSHAVVIRR